MSDFSLIDALGLKNQDSQFSRDNFKRVGNSVLLSPLTAVGALLLPADWIGLGYFEPDAQIAPETEVERSPITVQNPQGGPPITLMEDVSDVSAIYTIEAVTPDEYVQALHLGAVPTALADAALADSTISPFEVGMSIDCRMIVIRITEGTAATRRYELYWHPRVAVQSDGFGEYEGRTTRQFRIPVRNWEGSFTDAGKLADFDTQKGSMGAIFSGPIAELPALVAALKAEALAS